MRLISPKPDSTGTYEHEIQLSSVQGIKQTEATGKKELDLCTCLPSEQLVVDQIICLSDFDSVFSFQSNP